MTASFAWNVDVDRFGRFLVSSLGDDAEASAKLSTFGEKPATVDRVADIEFEVCTRRDLRSHINEKTRGPGSRFLIFRF